MSALIEIIATVIHIFTFAILAKVLMSWVINMGNSRNETVITIYQVLTQITEPILGPLRRIIPSAGMFDFSPLIAIIALQAIALVLYELA